MTANLSQAQKDYFIEMAETSLNDLCTIQKSGSESQDSLGQVQHVRVDYDNIPCGISFASLAYKNELNQSVTLNADAILRLSLSETISINDIVICRNKIFTVDGVYEGLSLKVVALKSMQTDEASS